VASNQTSTPSLSNAFGLLMAHPINFTVQNISINVNTILSNIFTNDANSLIAGFIFSELRHN